MSYCSFLSAIPILCWTSTLAQEQFEIRFAGNIQLTQGNTTRIIDYKVRSAQEKWYVHYTEGPHTNETGCDGENIYRTFQSRELRDPKGNLIPFTNGLRTLPVSAAVEPGRVPHYQPVFTKLLWVALASETYFTATSRPVPVPWASPINEPQALIFKSEMIPLAQASSLPGEITWRVEARQTKSAETHDLVGVEPSEQRQRNFKLIEGAKPGFLGGEYKVLSVTNIDGRRLPRTFSLSRYSLESGKLLERFVGSVDTVEVFPEGATSGWLPDVPSIGLSVADYRFKTSKIDYIAYNNKTGRWLSKDDPKLIPLFKKKLKASSLFRMKPQQSKQVPARTASGVTLFLAIQIPVILIFIFYLRKRKRLKRGTP